ncbi:c-type cytochrome [Endothiovibrio diazotrophicus]
MKQKILIAASAALLLSTAALADENRALKYRQSTMTLIGANFGPIGAMLKGEMPWDGAAATHFSTDLAAVAGLDQMRGYPAGSEGGHTKAKPEIWLNMDDFKEKMEAFQGAAAKLGEAGAGGDKGAIGAAFKETAKTCKGCHKEYKSKEYLD